MTTRNDEDVPQDGMAAFGHAVPARRRSQALRHLREMAPSVPLDAAMSLIDGMSVRIERDDPYDALDFATGEAWTIHASSPVKRRRDHDPERFRLDVTGGYRLLAALCVDEVTA